MNKSPSLPTTDTSAAQAPRNDPGGAMSPTFSVNAEREAVLARLAVDALHEQSPLLASLQLTGGDLLQMASVLQTAVMTAASERDLDVDRLQELLPFLETHIKLAKQADRLLRLQHELRQSLPTSKQSQDGPTGKIGKQPEAKKSLSVTQSQ